jgi:formylglycine-generating enzyme required for sulfatase activity
MRRLTKTVVLAVALLPACTIESEFVDMIQEQRDSSSRSYRDMVSVPGGTYTQSDATESFSHTISDFRIGKYEVTYELWYAVCKWALSNGYSFGNPGCEGNDGVLTSPGGAEPTGARYEPVTRISWRDAVVWCNAYSEMSGHVAVYYSDSAMLSPLRSCNTGYVDTTFGSQDNPYVNWGADGYRLPTEGEWQYAASYRDGTSWTPHYCASGVPDMLLAAETDFVAWHSGNSGGKTQVVGTKMANQLGICDMSGNVSELCWDAYGDYPTNPQTDYRGLPAWTYRTSRGGSFQSTRGGCDVGVRGAPDVRMDEGSFGFRVAQGQ